MKSIKPLIAPKPPQSQIATSADLLLQRNVALYCVHPSMMTTRRNGNGNTAVANRAWKKSEISNANDVKLTMMTITDSPKCSQERCGID